MSRLGAVVDAARAAEEAAERLRELVAAAHEAGESVSDLAASAGVTRQTIYRWVAMAGGRQTTSIQTVRDAMQVIATHASPTGVDYIQKRVGGRDETLLLMAFRNSLTYLSATAQQDMTDEERATLGMAMDYADRADRRRRAQAD